MTIPTLVQDFYDRIWNAGDLEAIPELLSEDFAFRSSLGSGHHGRDAFAGYVRSVRTALSHYRCEILACVTEDDRAFAQMRFSGLHTAEFRGFPPTGLPLHWLGAALFRLQPDSIRELWVLGDLASLDRLLQANQQKSAPDLV